MSIKKLFYASDVFRSPERKIQMKLVAVSNSSPTLYTQLRAPLLRDTRISILDGLSSIPIKPFHLYLIMLKSKLTESSIKLCTTR